MLQTGVDLHIVFVSEPDVTLIVKLKCKQDLEKQLKTETVINRHDIYLHTQRLLCYTNSSIPMNVINICILLLILSKNEVASFKNLTIKIEKLVHHV